MSTTIIITLCSLLLIAYIFDLSSSKTRIPSVILLLFLGWAVKEITIALKIELPDLSSVLPGLGTVGLILIVLEGSLDLELKRSKIVMINRSLIGALLPMFALSFALAFMLFYFANYPFKESLVNSIPFSVISSAIAIPSVRSFKPSTREYIVYESSFSDILGVLFFNFITVNTIIDLRAFGNFSLQIIIMFIVSFITTIALSYFLSKVEHHIKFIPIILLVILIYTIS